MALHWSWVLIIALLALAPTLVVLPSYLRQRARRRQRNVFSRWPIRTVALSEVDDVFATGPLGPSLETEVRFLGGADLLHVVGATTDAEAWVLAVLSRTAMCMFEFGTATGRTAYLWAANSPPGAEVITLTLRPDDLASYRDDARDAEKDRRNAVAESLFTRFYYSGTPVEPKIRQLYGDSKAFDESAWVGKCDLVFVDGSHARSYVESDSRKALHMVRPGGLVLWHDYRGPRAVPGVYQALNALAQEIELVHIARTSLVVHRRPQA